MGSLANVTLWVFDMGLIRRKKCMRPFIDSWKQPPQSQALVIMEAPNTDSYGETMQAIQEFLVKH